jgi:hypothetical protein
MIKNISIHSVPRSGSTWLGEILNSSPKVKYAFQPLFSYALKGALTPTSNAGQIAVFFDRLLRTEDDFINQTEQRRKGTLATFPKEPPFTHVGYKEVRYNNIVHNLLHASDTVRPILLIRNPIEVMDSWVGAPREFDPRWNVDAELITGQSKNRGRPEEFFGLEKWIEAAHGFLKLSKAFPDRTLIVEYAQLKADPLHHAQQIFSFCDLEFGPQTQSFIAKSTSAVVHDTYSVFRGSRSKAVKNLTEDQVALIKKEVHQAGLGRFLNDT